MWATVRTTASAYQERLIADFANGTPVARVACPGLAEAIDHGDKDAATAAIASAAERTPADCDSVVLGCTHYPLVAPQILERLLRRGSPCTTAQRRSPGRLCGA
ncbi:aspartate/glutamate racemase family protein [Streptomyces sp. S1D4-11]